MQNLSNIAIKFSKWIIFLKILIEICSKQTDDIQQIKDQLQYQISQKINSPDKETYKVLKDFLNQAFNLCFNKDNAKFLIFDRNVIQKGKNKIKKFIQFLQKTHDFQEDPSSKFMQFYKFSRQLYEQNKRSILWTNENNKTYIQILIQKSENRQQHIVNFLNNKNKKPNLLQKVYAEWNQQTLLFRILNSTLSFYGDKKKIVNQGLLPLIKQQNIDLKQGNIDEKGSYQKKLQRCGMKSGTLIQLQEKLGTSNKQIYSPSYSIYDLNNHNCYQKLDYDEQFDHEVKKALIKIIENNKQIKVSHIKANLKIQIIDQLCYGTLQPQIFRGLLVPHIQPFPDSYTWEIFENQSWNIIKIEQDRKQILSNSMKNNRNFEFILKNNQKYNLQIDIKTFKVYKIFTNSKQKLDFGFIFWRPCVKKVQINKIKQENPEQQEDYTLIQKDKNFFEPIQKTPIFSCNEQKIYQNLAILYDHIPNCDCQKTNNNSIRALNLKSSQTIDIWLYEQLKFYVRQCFTNSNEKDCKNITIKQNDKSILNKIKQKYFKILPNKFHENIKINQDLLQIRGIQQNQKLVSDYTQYLIALQKKQAQKKIFLLQNTNQNITKLQEIAKTQNQDGLTANKINNKVLEIKGDDNMIKQLIMVVNQQVQVSHIFQNKKVLKEYQLQSPQQYILLTKDIKIKQLQDMEDSFQGIGTKINLSLFWKKFLQIRKRIQKQKQQNEKVIIKYPGASKDYQIFQQILEDQPQTKIMLHPPNLQVHTKKIYQQEIIKLLNTKINEIKFQIRQKSQTSFELKYIEQNISRCIEKILRTQVQSIKRNDWNNRGVVQVQCTNVNPKTYLFKLLKGGFQQNKIFNQTKRKIIDRLFQYNKIFKQLRKTNQIKAKALQPLRKINVTSKQDKQIVQQIITIYRQKIGKIIEEVFNNQKIELQKAFCESLQTDYNKKFQWDCKLYFLQELSKKDNGIFADYMIKLIEKKVLESKLSKNVKNARTNLIISRMEIDILKLDEMLLEGQIKQTQYKRIIIALRTLVATYLSNNLPIINHLEQFSQKIQKYKNIIVKVGTGSGKSTILPPFLVAMGFKRVIVTQPRRLPCKMIYKRIQKTHSKNLVGYSFAGKKQNERNPLHYTTDGLLKVLLVHKPQLIKQIDVIMLDEIHERSKNIDFILAMIPKLRQINPELKIILCSATIDQKMIKIIDDSNQYGTFTVEVERFPVKQFKIQKQSILQKAHQLSSNLKKNQKMLIFLPGIDQVELSVKLFRQKYKKLAYPLHGAQRNYEHDMILQNGQILFATSIAQTSLTFENLKYVIDSRKARYVYFDQKLGMNVTKQAIASKSSIKQRLGRVGRDCPGQYYYQQNLETNIFKQLQFDATQLDRLDLTNSVFQWLIIHEDINKVQQILKKLMGNSQNFQNKFLYSKYMLKDYNIIYSSGQLRPKAKKYIMKFGNLNDIRFNLALAESEDYGCSYQMIAIISFLMYGSKIISKVIQSIPNKFYHPSGDIMTIGQNIVKISQNIKLREISFQNILPELSKYDELKNQTYFSIYVRILKQMKKFMLQIQQIESSNNWKNILKCLVSTAFQNDFYFHEIDLGGQKGNYSKLKKNIQYYCNKNRYNQIHYKINNKSLVFKKKIEQLPPVVLSLNSFCNTVQDGILSFCCVMQDQINHNLQLIYQCNNENQQIPYGDKISVLNQQQILRNQILSDGLSLNSLKFTIKKKFNEALNYYKSLGQKIYNKNVIVDLNVLLNQEIIIANRRTAGSISREREQLLKYLFAQISLPDIFYQLRIQFQNYYNVEIKIPFQRGQPVTINNASNAIIKQIMKRFQSFFSWFVRCQNICLQNKKVSPQLINKRRFTIPQIPQGIQKRINMIVDSEIDYHVVKSWAHSDTMQYLSRTMRMVAVCWVLTTKFDCSIKGGFVRDWVIRNKQYLPPGDLTNLLQKTTRNGHLQVVDQSVIPADIDVDLPFKKFFDIRKFYQQMRKLGITMQISPPQQCKAGPDFWRIHIVFDKGSVTGGFTAQLIQAYCQISHDRCDFDVNLFYLKKDHKNAIGYKMSLQQLRPLNPNINFTNNYSRQELIQNCIDQKMKQINPQVNPDRKQKFQSRGWKIDPIIYQPTIYQTQKTLQYKFPIDDFINQVPQFLQFLPNSDIREVYVLKNTHWDQCYDAVRQWIINQGHKTNQRYLFHGSKQQGIKGILKNSFDSRYFAPDGYYGRGVYFADDSSKSNGYSGPCSQKKNWRAMFICKVALGNQQHCTSAANGKLGPSKGYHSILGTAGRHRQYIIDRFGQAKPVFLVYYTC